MIKLLHGDCLELMKDIPDNSIDMVLADIPYGTTKCNWDIIIDFELMWEELKRITKDNGAICLFGTEPFSSHLRLSNLEMFRYDWYWYKNTQTGISLAKHQPMRSIELLHVFSRQKTIFYPQKMKSRHGRKTGGKNGKNNPSRSDHHSSFRTTPDRTLRDYVNPRNVLEFKAVGNQNGSKLHPTQKPVPLLEYLIKTYTLEGQTILDFTAGSGSTGEAAINLGRNCILMEKEKKYFDVMTERLNKISH